MSSIVERCSVNPCGLQRAIRTLWALPLLALAVMGWQPDLHAQPANDHFTKATVLAGPFGTTSGTSLGATVEPGEPFHYGPYRLHSVWHRWTAPATGYVTFDTFGTWDG